MRRLLAASLSSGFLVITLESIIAQCGGGILNIRQKVPVSVVSQSDSVSSGSLSLMTRILPEGHS